MGTVDAKLSDVFKFFRCEPKTSNEPATKGSAKAHAVPVAGSISTTRTTQKNGVSGRDYRSPLGIPSATVPFRVSSTKKPVVAVRNVPSYPYKQIVREAREIAHRAGSDSDTSSSESDSDNSSGSDSSGSSDSEDSDSVIDSDSDSDSDW